METSARSPASWRLVRELGLDYEKNVMTADSTSLLCPVSAEQTKSGGLLIVDDELQDRNPPLMLFRTLLLSAEREVIYDSKVHGVEDAYGCLMDGGQFAILRRARGELCVHAPSGELTRCVDLAGISGRRPKIFCRTPRGSFLVAFVGGRCELDLAEIDGNGRVLWSCVDFIASIGIPSSLQLLADQSILVADELHHVVWRLDRSGSSRILWGNWHSPSSSPGELHRPRCAQLLPGGTLVIADSGNGRIVVVNRSGHAANMPVRNTALFSPASVRRTKNGKYLICDAASRSVFELDARGTCVPRYGVPKVRRRHFSFPRSVQYLRGNRYLIANTAQNTIVHADCSGVSELQVNSMRGLFWPRAARKTRRGTILIADGRNSCIREISSGGEELRYLRLSRNGKQYVMLQDPHDVRLLPNGNLLIVDSQQHLVFETDWRGRAAWVIGMSTEIKLADPHSAQQLSDGRIMISDTRNHRIVFVDPKTGSGESISEIRVGATHCRLNLPRYAEVAPDGTLAIADAGNNRVLVTDLNYSFLSVLSEIPESPIPYLRAPRWVQPVTRNEMIISDHGNHRVLHLRRRGAQQ